MRDIRCCDCGHFLPKYRECDAPCPWILKDDEESRRMGEFDAKNIHHCDAFTPLKNGERNG